MRNSRTCFSWFLIVAASLIVSTAALAGEQVLEFKLVTKAIDPGASLYNGKFDVKTP
jgi:hypothetical protein